MKRFCRFVVAIVAIGCAVYAVRHVRDKRARAIALPVVYELGGHVGSITAPFGGTEYYVTFDGQSLTRQDVDKLVVLNALARNWNLVTISLENVSISSADRDYMRQLLPEVRIQPVESEVTPRARD